MPPVARGVSCRSACGSGRGGRSRRQLAEAMERLGRHVEPPAYLNQGCTFAQQGSHRVAPFVQQPLFHAAALAAPERHTVRTPRRQGLLRPHRDQAALDLGNQSEGEAEHLAVDAVVEGVTLLRAEEPDVAPQALLHDRHDLGQRPAQPRELGDDERVAPPQAFEYAAELAFAVALPAAGRLGDPAVDRQTVPLGETADLFPLIADVLLLRADSHVGYCHKRDFMRR